MYCTKSNSEFRWVLAWAVVIVLLASLPYAWGAFITPPGYSFVGLTQNIDDGAVYLSWMRQAADGHFFIRNLFTNEPQPARQFNLLFLKMGWFAAFTHLPLIVVFHLFRIVLGIALILGIWQFSKLFLDDAKQRRLLVPLVGLSAGIGWLIPNVQSPVGSVDVWQPEAITFLSMYLNPLFLAGLLLMLGALYWLELARRQGSARYAIFAGLHLLLLGNIHTYDVLTAACVWTAYLIALWAIERRFPARTIALSVLAAGIALPSVAYQFFIYTIDPIYNARANTPIPSPPIWSFFEGYGLILLGAAIAAAMMWGNRKSQISNLKWLLLVVWSVVGFAVPYIPIAQQRKLIMGTHIPLCILATIAIAYLMARLNRVFAVCLAGAILIFVFQSNGRFLLLDAALLREGRTVTRYSPYLPSDWFGAMAYIRQHARQTDAILCSPQTSLFLPAYTGKQVYYGHWSETPDYLGALSEWFEFSDPSVSIQRKLDILAHSKSKYVVFDSPDQAEPLVNYARGRLARAARYGEMSVYRVLQ